MPYERKIKVYKPGLYMLIATGQLWENLGWFERGYDVWNGKKYDIIFNNSLFEASFYIGAVE